MLSNRSEKSPIIVIAVDGKGGAGKTTVAKQLADFLNAGITHTDDFTTFDHPAFFGTDVVVNQVLQPISDGIRSLSYRRLQVWPGEPSEVIDQPVSDIMILEGCGASCELYRPYISYTIFVGLDDSLRLARMIERDVDKGGRAEAENERIGKLWEIDENKYFEQDNPALRADVIIDSTNAVDIQNVIERLY